MKRTSALHGRLEEAAQRSGLHHGIDHTLPLDPGEGVKKHVRQHVKLNPARNSVGIALANTSLQNIGCCFVLLGRPLAAVPRGTRGGGDMRIICTLSAAAMLVAACAAQVVESPAPPLQLDAASTAQTAAFDPCDLKARLHGKATEVLVLGSMHLSAAQEGFDPAVLEPLLDRLAAF
jgi:hypothetical protein